jgi:hypothetical protein
MKRTILPPPPAPMPSLSHYATSSASSPSYFLTSPSISSAQFPPSPFAEDCHPVKKRKNLELPSFLSKTFSMICECPTHIASWNQEGTSFYVFNSKELSEKLIPQYFKHNNFSSFVRQLNFYGFQKVRSNTQPPNPKEEDTRILEFKHPFFQRDNPDLLSEIRRVGVPGGGAVVQQDYDILKCQITELASQVEYLTSTVHELKSILKRCRFDDGVTSSSKLPRLCQRWDTTLDEETLEMLMSLDRGPDDETGTVPASLSISLALTSCHSSLSEPPKSIRGAPYSHSVFKTDCLLSQKTRAEMHPNSSLHALDPLEHRTSVPLNQACALFGSLLSEYYTSANFSTVNLPKNSIPTDRALSGSASSPSSSFSSCTLSPGVAPTGAGMSHFLSPLSEAYAKICPPAMLESASSPSQRKFGEKIGAPNL